MRGKQYLNQKTYFLVILKPAPYPLPFYWYLSMLSEMIFNRKTFIFFVFAICLWGLICCISPSKRAGKISLSQEQIHQMDQAFLFMKNKDFLKGAQIYDSLAHNLKDNSSKALMLFNSGVAYKSAGQCRKALARLRKLLDVSLKKSSFKARGLLEISYTYECLGDRDLAFFSLKDIEKIHSFLPWGLRKTVYPARLAIAHARLGQLSQAEHYKSLSLAEILQSRGLFSSENELNEQLSRLFYLMGRSYVRKEHILPEAFLQSFPYHQLFLLQSLFLKNKTWSDLSKKELDSLFNKLDYALSKVKNKEKHKKSLIQSIDSARQLIKRENFKQWENFYSKRSKSILKLLSSSS